MTTFQIWFGRFPKIYIMRLFGKPGVSEKCVGFWEFL
jgi:hypothetical protein